MAINRDNYQQLLDETRQHQATLVAVSKTKPVADIQELYELGQRDFGENYVQELVEKQPQLPSDIRWHFIGHLQRNKVKYIAPFVYMIHGVDSFRLLEEISRQADKQTRSIAVLLQVHIAQEETKFGLDESELDSLLQEWKKVRAEGKFTHIALRGLMGMASFSDDQQLVREEFRRLRSLLDRHRSSFTHEGQEPVLSMGMSADYRIALEEGSGLIRIGSSLFGARSTGAAL